ncbi:MAG: NAD(P)/FAD-dependent oxidoreductase [Gemmatimonadota bacterium]
MEADYLLVGGGLAAAAAAEGIRERDPDGTILLVSEETEPPYQRPPLSKEYLKMPDAPRELLHVKPIDWYAEAGVRLELGQAVLGLDTSARTALTARGNEIRAERILLATGGRARVPEIPGIRLPGVHTVRFAGDSEGLRASAAEARSAVLVGAGFIGMEISASLTELGVACTVVEADVRVWPGALPGPLSGFVQARFEDRGVTFRLGSTVREIAGRTRAEEVVLSDGVRLPCDFVVIGVGMIPCDGLAREAGIATDDGILVDERGETSHAFVYAAGDVARFPDPVFGGRSRVEHWDHARVHGRLVGRNMAGARESYAHLSHFFSDVFDWKLNVVGRPGAADAVLDRGDPDGPRLVLCLAESRLTGIVLVNATRDLEACRSLVRARPTLHEIPEDFGPS